MTVRMCSVGLRISLALTALTLWSVEASGTSFKRSTSRAIDCPKRVLTDDEVGEFVEAARQTDKEGPQGPDAYSVEDRDLPPAPKKFKTKVRRMRCMYVYYEEVLSEEVPTYQTFTVDPYGDVYEFYQNDAMKELLK
jgi:hypothetical protein